MSINSLRKDVVIMEDDKKKLSDIKKTLNKMGFTPLIAKSKNEILKLAKEKHLKNFILDINMGSEREHEGLDALETLKNYDDNIFVGFLTGYPTRYKTLASRLKVNVFQPKTTNRQNDIYKITCKMLQHNIDIVESTYKSHYSRLSNLRGIDMNLDFELDEDVNFTEFQKLISDEKWKNKHLNQYIAIVDGNIAGIQSDGTKLLEKVKLKYPKKDIFFSKIEDNEPKYYPF